MQSIKWVFLSLIIIFLSCKTQKNIAGYYSIKGTDFYHSIELNKDGSFILKEGAIEYPASCNGTWHYLAKDTIILKCNPETTEELLQSGRISDRIQKTIILNPNHIQIGKLILERDKHKTN